MIVGVETGGTKIVCAAARPGAVERPVLLRRFPTTTPTETFGRIDAFLAEAAAEEPLDAIGVASFGPVDADPASARYGWITSTPKAGWRDTDVLAAMPDTARVPTAFLTDVGGAAVGEDRWGAGRTARSTAYATVGTGVGVGLVVDGRVLVGAGWPELGHLLVRRRPGDDFAGVCPYHGDCLEGIASGPAVLARWGADASSLPEPLRSEALDVLASALAQLVLTTVLTVGAERVVLGGGVMHAPGLLERIRAETARIAAGYGPASLSGDLSALVVPPTLGDSAGVIGAMTAAQDLLG